MKVRVLLEQEARRDNPARGYLASGEVADIDKAWAVELLQRGDAEPVAQKPASRAEKRPGNPHAETR